LHSATAAAPAADAIGLLDVALVDVDGADGFATVVVVAVVEAAPTLAARSALDRLALTDPPWR
jgi:hypothetical protein